jgi:outer membrane protein assembly factor BamD (BamD/ComL family)/Tol biopolymer transport system component
VETLIATAQRELARVRDEEERRLRSAALYREAQTALAREEWTAATEQLQAVLNLEPTHAEAQIRLHEVRQQQELATWYATGQQHYDAGQWQAALEDFRRVQARGGNYKEVETLIATAQHELARVHDEERRRLRIAALYREAQTALAGEEWAAAVEKLQAVLRLEPTHAEAQARLREVRQQQELATWYATGQQHYDAGQWQAALEDFRRVRKRGGNYKGVDSLIVVVRRKISEEKPASDRIYLLWIGGGGALALLGFIVLAWWGMQRGQPELPLRWQSIAVLSGYTAPVKSAVFSPDSKWVVAASYDPTVWVWEASTGKAVAELQGHTAPVKSVVFSPDGKWIATASDDKMARVWEASTGKAVAELQGHTAPVKSAVFSPDGKWIATASSADPTVRVWEASTGKGVAVLQGHTAPVKSAVFSPDSKWVVAASDDPTVWVWEASTGKAVAELRGHEQWVNSVVFSPDGKWVATASDDKTARVWEASTGKAVAELRGHAAEVNSAVFSRDGKWIVTASSDSTARVWKASTGKAVAELRGHTAEVNSAVFSRDGKWIVTASSDYTAQVWKASRE